MNLQSKNKLNKVRKTFDEDGINNEKTLYRNSNVDHSYFSINKILKEMDDNAEEIEKSGKPILRVLMSEIWKLHVVNSVKDLWQEELNEDISRKAIIQKFSAKSKKYRLYCPTINVFYTPLSVEQFLKNIKAKMREDKNLITTFSYQTPGDNDGAAHFMGFVCRGNQIKCLDPATGIENREWGHTKYLKECQKRFKNLGFEVVTYKPVVCCQSLELDTFCQSWSLFLIIKEIKEELNQQTFSVEDDLFPFLYESFRFLEKDPSKYVELKKELLCKEENDSILKKKHVSNDTIAKDLSYFYYTSLSQFNVSDVLSLMTCDDVAKTILYSIPMIGTRISLDNDEEKEAIKMLGQVAGNDTTFLKKYKRRFKKIGEFQKEIDVEEKRQQVGTGRKVNRKKKTLFNKKKVFVAKNGRRYIKNGIGQTRFIPNLNLKRDKKYATKLKGI